MEELKFAVEDVAGEIVMAVVEVCHLAMQVDLMRSID